MATPALGQDDALPLVVGVTGHRHLREADLPALAKAVYGIFAQLKADYPHSPLRVLSPLAEGADRLVAQVALDCGAELVAPLPLEQAEYERDFRTPESLAEFRALVGRAAETFAVPLVELEEYADPAIDNAARNRQYAAVGGLVVRGCQVLVALWDGSPSEKVGSTAQVVQFQLQGIPPAYRQPTGILDGLDVGSVHHVLSPRAGEKQSGDGPSESAHSAESPGTLRVLHPPAAGAKGAKLAEQRLADIDALNADAQELAKELAADRRKSESYLFKPEVVATLPPVLRRLLARFTLTDVLAQHFQQITLRVFLVLLLIAFGAAFALQTYLSIPRPPLVLLASYAGALVLLIAIYGWSRRARHENKYLDYRALAEGLRVQIFWRLAGLPDSVADHYLRRQRGELDWIRSAVRGWYLTDAADPVSPTENAPAALERLRLVHDRWVNDQRDYFQKRAAEHGTKPGRLRIAGKTLLGAGTALAVVRVFFEGNAAGVILLVAMLPALAGLLLVYIRARALQDHANQYQRMHALFAQASEMLSQFLAACDVAAARELLRELGQEALAESGDWLIMHRDRPLESPGLG